MADSPQPGGIKRSFDDTGSSGADWPSRKSGRPSSGSPGRYVLPSILDGSGRVPTISRKVRACAACKKQKIRCDFEEGESTCVRCKKMKLECVVNRSLQTILDEDVEYVIHHHHPSLVVDLPKNMKMEEGKKKFKRE